MYESDFYFFWRGPFSQWAKYPVDIGGIAYCTAEQYKMVEKARLFGMAEDDLNVTEMSLCAVICLELRNAG